MDSRTHLSGKQLAVAAISIVMAGGFGLWLATQTYDPTGSRMRMGVLIMLSASVAFVFLAWRDLRPTESERQIRWARLKTKGRRRYLMREFLKAQLFWLGFFLLFSLRIKNETGNPKNISPVFGWIVIWVLWTLFSLIRSTFWWWREARRYEPRLTLDPKRG